MVGKGINTREWMEILVIVKTSPLPSTAKTVVEHVCTAGIRKDGSWIRIYPISFRFLPEHEKYHKYQWIELEVFKATGDMRPESYRPTNVGGIRLGARIGEERSWIKRRQYVIPPTLKSMCDFEKYKRHECSLGVIKPRKVLGIQETPNEDKWPEKVQAMLDQMRLFDNKITPLKRLPYKFHYHFLCSDPNCGGHTKQILDWELTELYWNELHRLGAPDLAAKSVKYKFLDVMCAADKDTHFFVGTDIRHNSWMVTGVFWPTKTPPMLFSN